MKPWLALSFLAWVAGLAFPAHAGSWTARAYPEADGLFHQDSSWLGSDAAYTVPLDSGRTLWIFGDTLIATSQAHVRAESTFVHNTVAVQTGLNPCTGRMEFAWRRNAAGAPAPFFPDPGPGHRFWPQHGIRLTEGPLVVFLFDIVDTPGRGLGFDNAGYAIARIDRPEGPAALWQLEIIRGPSPAFDAVPGTAVVRDGAFVVVLAIRNRGEHAGALVRFLAADLAQGTLDRREWWAGSGRGWVPEQSVGPTGPAFVMDDAGAECSLHWDPRSRRWIHIASYGFGASMIGIRTAAELTGPWSKPRQVYRPPESDWPHPFVYAGKGHRELATPEPGGLLMTYATNTWDFGEQFTPAGSKSIYWPHFVLLRTIVPEL